MKYFVDPYKRYYEKLSSMGDVSQSASSVKSSTETATSSITSLSSSIDDSKWSEMGIDELKTNVLPSLLANHKVLESNINILTKIVNLATGSLLSTLASLKAEDERLETLTNEYNTLLSNPEYVYDSEGNKTDALTAEYSAKLTAKKKEMDESEEKCKALVAEADGIIIEIKSLDASVSDFSVDLGTVSASSSPELEASLGSTVKDGKMIEIEFNGKKFYIANTHINAVDYEKYIQQSGAYQGKGLRPSGCAIISQIYAMDMMRGTTTSKNRMANDRSLGASSRFNRSIKSTDEDTFLEGLYNELVNGRVTTLQVTQRDTTTGSDGHYTGPRHVVTVVGFDSSVKSYKDLNPNTILVLDCADGKIQTLSQSRSEGGHERDLYARKDNKGEYSYFAHIATETFINKEVENETWQSKYGAGSKA